jgi:hypothetical protein
VPEVAWRVGVDLNPLDPADAGTAAWLETLVWPEHEHRRRRLAGALRLASAAGLRIVPGNLLGCIAELVAQAPAGATPVVVHSATLAYLTAEERTAAAAAITGSGARWISFEGRGVVTPDRDLPEPVTPDTLFVAALDRVPAGLASGHGDTMTVLGTQP